jgi:glycosyltransferase involved in cell wall biosynthesis
MMLPADHTPARHISARFSSGDGRRRIRPMPAASIILPTFDRLEHLTSAIDSVFDQTVSDWELVIADDGSGGETRRYLQGLTDPRVTLLWLEHSGNPARVRNAALAVARGAYLAFLDSDDVWAPAKLEKQLEALRARPDHRWCYTYSDCIDSAGNPVTGMDLRPPGEGWILESLLRDLAATIGMPALMAERALVQELGGFDEGQPFCEDHDLCLRLAMRSPVVAVPEPLCSIRLHSDSYSADRIGEYSSRVRLYGKMSKLVDDPRLRALCLEMRARQSLVVAGLQGERGEHRAAWSTLGRSSAFAWRYPRWWLGALKAVTRPRLPRAIVQAYRQRPWRSQ